MNPAFASSPLSIVLVQEPAKISNIDLSHKHKNFSYSVQFQTRTLVLCTRMENLKYFFVSSFVLLCCLRDAKSEKSDNEIDKSTWTPKLRDPVKVKYFIKFVPASFSSKCRISVWNCKQNNSFSALSSQLMQFIEVSQKNWSREKINGVGLFKNKVKSSCVCTLDFTSELQNSYYYSFDGRRKCPDNMKIISYTKKLKTTELKNSIIFFWLEYHVISLVTI